MKLTIPTMQTESNIVVTHRGCSDGFCATAIAHLAIHGEAWETLSEDDRKKTIQHFYTTEPGAENVGKTVEYLATKYTSESMVKFFDVAFEQKEFDLLLAKFPNAKVWDHHITTQKSCKEHPQLYFNNEKSGAMLAWDHYFPDRVAPALVQYVQDRDLWTFKLDNSKAISHWSFQTLRPRIDDLGKWKSYLLSDNWIPTAKTVGETIISVNNRLMEDVKRNILLIKIAEHNVAMVNSQVFRSELGNDLCIEHPECHYSLVWYHNANSGKVYVSLRSEKTNPNAADLSEIAKRYGGGGHKHAAGFELSWEEFGVLLKNPRLNQSSEVSSTSVVKS